MSSSSDRTAPLEPDYRPAASFRELMPPDRRYDERGELGQGGMAIVIRLYDHVLGREVAMKRLRIAGPEDVARFVREARVTGMLEHPGIPPVHDLGEVDGQYYFTMKRIGGSALSDLLEGDCPPLPELLEILLKICDTLAFAHSRGVVHRDLKPGNVMVGDYGEVLVMDWGLAKADDDEELSSSSESSVEPISVNLTRVGQVMGTPNYMAPEQARGELDKVDRRSDVFSLGAILFRMLFGQSLYRGETIEQILLESGEGRVAWPDGLRGVPPELVAIARKALSLARADRYQDVEAMARDLRAYRGHLPISVYRAPIWRRTMNVVRRHPTGFALAGLSMLAVVVGSVYYGYSQRRIATAERQRADTQGQMREAAARRKKATEPFLQALSMLRQNPGRERVLAEVVPLLKSSVALDGSFLAARQQLAELYRATGQAEAAREAYQALYQSGQRGDDEVAFTLGRLALESGDVAAAEGWFGRLSGHLARIGRAELTAARGDDLTARSEMRALVAALADDDSAAASRARWRARWLLARLIYAPGQRNALGVFEAQQVLARVIAEKPGHPYALIYLGFTYVVNRRMGEAREAFGGARAWLGDHPLVLWGLAAANLVVIKSGPAVRLMKRAMADPRAERYPRLKVALLEVLDRANMTGEANRLFSQLVAQFNARPDRELGVALVKFALRWSARQPAARKPARRMLEVVVRRYAGTSDALLLQAQLAHQEGRIEDTERAYRQVFARDPLDLDAAMGLARLLTYYRGRPEQGLALVEKVRKLRPDNPMLLLQRARILGRMAEGDRRLIPQADAAFREVKVRLGHTAPFYLRRGELHWRTGRLREAERDYMVALELLSENYSGGSSAWYTLALIYRARREYERAGEAWQHYLDMVGASHPQAALARQQVARCAALARLRTSEPRSAAEVGLKAEVLEGEGRFKEALPYLTRALAALAPRSELIARYHGVDLRLRRAACLWRLRAWPQALADYQAALESTEKLLSGPRLKDTMRHNLENYRRQGLQGAIICAGALSARDPKLRDTTFVLLARYGRLGRRLLRGLMQHRVLAHLRGDPRWKELLEKK